jgi:hypothetical protein
MSEVYTLQLRQLPDNKKHIPLIVGLVIEDEGMKEQMDYMYVLLFEMPLLRLFSTYLTFLTNRTPGKLNLANTSLPSTTPLAGISTSKTTINRLFSSMRQHR